MSNGIKQIQEIMEVGIYNTDVEYPKFIVESYQRGYRWGKDRAKQLIDDIYANYKKYYKKFEESGEKTGYEYCIQPLVIKNTNRTETDTNGTVHEIYSVIDGQQRLTTLYLIFCALNKVREEKNKKLDHKNMIHITYKRNQGNSFSIDDLMNSNNKLSIDQKYAKAVYEFALEFINSIIAKDSKYFEFTGTEKNPNIDYTSARLDRFENMIQFRTTIIWYEPGDEEENAFDIFNDKKIPLSGSDLVKATFMNPDNYYVPNPDVVNTNDLIKSRQIVIGNEWDRMEQQLHDPDFWFFFPHNDNVHVNTRMDALIDFFVYFKLKNKNMTAQELLNNYLNDKKYSFKKLEELILADLSKCNSTNQKFECMEEWWRQLRELFETYWSVYAPFRNEGEGNAYSVFHRTSLIQYLQKQYFENITRGSANEGYLKSLEENCSLVNILKMNSNKRQISELNKIIIGYINGSTSGSNGIWKNQDSNVFEYIINGTKCYVDKNTCDTWSKKIRSLIYFPGGKNMLIRIFLIIHSLEELEKNSSSVARFSFRDFCYVDEDAKRWILEHVFARQTEVFAEDRGNIIDNINDCGWEEYIDYKYKDILDQTVIDKIKGIKSSYIDEYFSKYSSLKDEEKEKIWNYQTEYLADTADEMERDTPFCGFFKDNSLGNMGLIRKGDNTAVKNYIYARKKDIIMNRMQSGSFVPSGTYNMFIGAYCVKYDNALWYPCHRKNYLEGIIKSVEQYLS